MACTRLAINRVPQFTGEWCGPACAQMILLARRLVPDDSRAEQSRLWTEIRDKTGNTKGSFPIVEQCGSARPLTWASHPDALQKTLNAHIGGRTAQVIEHADEDSITERAHRSVKRGFAPAVLVQDATHWIVLFGCEHSERRDGSAVVIDGDRVTHMLVRDPANSGLPVRITHDVWIAKLYRVRCGHFGGKYVVVGAQ